MKIVREIIFILFLALGFLAKSQSPCNATTCQITLDLHTEDTLVICGATNTILTPARESCESIIWSNGSTSNSLTVFTSGWVKATKVLDSCSVTDSVFVLFPEVEEVFLPKKGGAYCEFDTFKAIKPIGQSNLVWTIKDSLTKVVTQSNNDTLRQYFSQPSLYIFTTNWKDKCGKSHQFKQETIAYGRPIVTVYDTLACGNSILVEPRTSFFGGDYLWSTGVTTKTTQISSSGEYWLRVTTNGCATTDTFQVKLGKSTSGIVNPIIKGPTSVCIGDTAVFSVPGITETDSLRWDVIRNRPLYLKDTVRYIPSSSVVTGNYKIQAFPTEKCEFDGVATHSYRIENIGGRFKDSTNCKITYASYSLPTGLDSYKWSNGSTSSFTSFYQSGEYYVEAKKGTCSLKDTFSLTIASQVPGLYSGSKRSNIWHFGIDAGLDFNTEPPTVIRGSQMNTREGCATICDESGKLLLYSDGYGVWNRYHQRIANGYYGSGSSTQSCIIVPHPGNSNLYYIFTTPASEQFNFAFGFCYILIDISANGGFGGVVEHKEQIYRYTTEKIVAVEHADGESIWIITHVSPGKNGGGSNAFVTFKVTRNGFDQTQIVQNIGSILNGGTEEKHRGQMKITPDGTKLALAVQGVGVELFNFDNKTGVLSNPRVVYDKIPNRLYGLEFSQNGKYLYYSDYLAKGLYQYDTELPADVAKNSTHSFQMPKIDSGYYFYGLQLAPNGKIYLAQDVATSHVSVINKPNLKGELADFSFNSLYLEGGLAELTFPSWITSYNVPSEPFSIRASNTCSRKPIEFTTSPQITNTFWDFGDGDLDTGMVVFKKFENGGDFTVKVESNEGCNQKNSVLDLKITKTPTGLIDTVNVCNTFKDYEYPEAISGIKWYKLNNSSSLGTSKNIRINQSGDYIAQVSNQNCIDTSHFSFYLETPPVLGVSKAYFDCLEEASLILDPGKGPKSYSWISENLVNQPLTVTNEGSYFLNYKGDSICNDTIEIKVVNQCKGIVFVPNAFTPNGDALNDLFVPFTKYLLTYKMLIYNQWGELIFVSDNENIHWDGSYKGEEGAEGIYTYVLKYSYIKNAVEIEDEVKGFVSLIR